MAARGTVLVADTTWEIADVIVEVLADEGYQVWQAAEVSAVITAILADPPDLILIDECAAEMSRRNVLRDLQTWGVDVPIVIMTTNPEAVDDLTAHGAARCLLKPFELDQLLDCVTRYIRPRVR
jgi:CheY-like chemotaxis protein